MNTLTIQIKNDNDLKNLLEILDEERLPANNMKDLLKIKKDYKYLPIRWVQFNKIDKTNLFFKKN